MVISCEDDGDIAHDDNDDEHVDAHKKISRGRQHTTMQHCSNYMSFPRAWSVHCPPAPGHEIARSPITSMPMLRKNSMTIH